MLKNEYRNIAALCPRGDRLAAQVEQLIHSQFNGGAAAANIDVSALTQDILERVSKACNIILYNVPEPQHSSSNIGFTENLHIRQILASIGGRRGHYLAQYFSITVPTNQSVDNSVPLKRDFYGCNYALLIENLYINTNVSTFNELIAHNIATFVPLSRYTPNNFPKWYSSELKCLIIE